MGLLNTIITVLVAFGSAIDAIDSADVGLTANLILAETVIASSDVFQIECLNGSEVLNGVITKRPCHVACAGSCCEEYNACDLFTGSVRTDGSCSGVNACSGAKIGLVENSCIGDLSCYNAGVSDYGIGSIKSSCNDYGACMNAAFQGHIDTIEESCNYGDYNCEAIGSWGSIGRILSSCSGTANAPVNNACADVGREEAIGDILSCCNGEDEVCCQSSYYCNVNDDTTLPEDCAAGPPPTPPPMGGVTPPPTTPPPTTPPPTTVDCRNGTAFGVEDSTDQTCEDACAESDGSCCVGENACDYFTGLVHTDGSCDGVYACYGASIDTVIDSCTGDDSCTLANIGFVDNSCHGDYSCSNAGVGDYGIDLIKSSCNDYGACRYAAYEGYIDSIEESCNYGDYNCWAIGSGGSIGRILSSCSGTEGAPVQAACAEVGVGEREVIYDILSCCNSDNGEGEVCCQSSNYCDNTITTLPEDCVIASPSASPSPSPPMDYLGFARHFADE